MKATHLRVRDSTTAAPIRLYGSADAIRETIERMEDEGLDVEEIDADTYLTMRSELHARHFEQA